MPSAAITGYLQPHAFAWKLGNFQRPLATPEPIKDASITTLRERLIKISANIIGHARNITFQMAQGAVAKNLFADILRPIPEPRTPTLELTA